MRRTSSAQRDLQRFASRLDNVSGATLAEAVLQWFVNEIGEDSDGAESSLRVDRLLTRRRFGGEILILGHLHDRLSKAARVCAPWLLSGAVEMSPALYGALWDESTPRVRALLRARATHVRFSRGCTNELLAQLSLAPSRGRPPGAVPAPLPGELLGHLRQWNQALFSECLKTANKPDGIHMQLREADAEADPVVRVQLRERRVTQPLDLEEVVEQLERPRTVFALPSQPLLEGYNTAMSTLTDYEGVALLVGAWLRGHPLALPLGALARGCAADVRRQGLLEEALVLRSQRALENLCAHVVASQPFRHRMLAAASPGIHRQVCLEALAAMAEPRVSAEWLEAVRPACTAATAVRALFRGQSPGDLVEEDYASPRCKMATHMVGLVADEESPPPAALAERFCRGLREALDPGLAAECLVVSADFLDPAALLVGLCAKDKTGVFGSRRVRHATAEGVMYFGDYHGCSASSSSSAASAGGVRRNGFFCMMMSQRDRHRAARDLCDEIDFGAIRERRLRLEDAALAIAHSNRARSDFWVWQPVRESVVLALRNAVLDRVFLVGSEEVCVEPSGASALALKVGGSIVAELNASGLSMAPRSRVGWASPCPRARDALIFLCDLLGPCRAAALLNRAGVVSRRAPSVAASRRTVMMTTADKSSPGGLASWSSCAHLGDVIKQARQASLNSVEWYIHLRAVALRLLGKRSAPAVEILVLSRSWEETPPRDDGAAALQQLLRLGEKMVPESEGADLAARAVRLVAQGWLTTPRPSRYNNLERRPAHSLAEHAALPVEAPLVCPRLEASLGLLHAKTLASATRVLSATPTLDGLIGLHNDMDYVGAEVRRRLVSQAALFRAFGVVAREEDLAVFALARGGLPPSVSVGLVETVAGSGALAKRRKRRRE